jgi:hypothetical protein
LRRRRNAPRFFPSCWPIAPIIARTRGGSEAVMGILAQPQAADVSKAGGLETPLIDLTSKPSPCDLVH